MDRTMAKGGYIETGEHAGDRYVFNMEGVGSRHMGLELNATYLPTSWLEINGMLSLGDWEWDSNATGYFYNQDGEPLSSTTGSIASGIMAPDHLWATLEQKGVKVGGSAQTTAALGLVVKPFQGMKLGFDPGHAPHATTPTSTSPPRPFRTAAPSWPASPGAYPGATASTSRQATASTSAVSTLQCSAT